MCDKVNYYLDIEQTIFLVVGYEAFADAHNDDVMVHVRTIELMGEASVKPDELPAGWVRSIEQFIKFKIAQAELSGGIAA